MSGAVAPAHEPGLRESVAAARVAAIARFPYLATALFAMDVVASPGAPGGGAVDARWRLHVDPAAAERWPAPAFAGLLVHHVLHLLRDHAGRARSVGVTQAMAGRWLLAADVEVDDDLHAAGVPSARPLVLARDLGLPEGRLAEELFAALADRPDAPPPQGDCGAGAHGLGDDAAGAGPGTGGGAGAGLSASTAELVRIRVAEDVARAERDGSDPIPAGIARWAAARRGGTADWRAVLAGELRRAQRWASGAVDHTWARPSRRSASVAPAVLPALGRPAIDAAVVVDTSASMGEAALGEAVGVVGRVLAASGSPVHVLAVDAEAHDVRRITSPRDVRLVGGGGTSMAAGLEHALGLRPRPAVVVVVTDGETAWPSGPPPRCRVVVALVGAPGPRRDRAAAAVPAWARTVIVDAPAPAG